MKKLVVLAIILALLLPAQNWAATPVHDASSNSGSQLNKTSTLAYSHTAGTLTNGIAVARVSSQDSTPGTISGVTYNGAAMTQCPTNSPAIFNTFSAISLWYYLNPPAGASAVVATFSEVMNDHIVNVSTYSNVDPSAPIGTCAKAVNFDTVNPSEARVTVTSAVGELVVGLGVMASATGAAATTNTSRANVLESTNTAFVGVEETGAASVNLSVTLAESRNNAALGVSLKPSIDSVLQSPNVPMEVFQ
jgi:hypothetical protein